MTKPEVPYTCDSKLRILAMQANQSSPNYRARSCLNVERVGNLPNTTISTKQRLGLSSYQSFGSNSMHRRRSYWLLHEVFGFAVMDTFSMTPQLLASCHFFPIIHDSEARLIVAAFDGKLVSHRNLEYFYHGSSCFNLWMTLCPRGKSFILCHCNPIHTVANEGFNPTPSPLGLYPYIQVYRSVQRPL